MTEINVKTLSCPISSINEFSIGDQVEDYADCQDERPTLVGAIECFPNYHLCTFKIMGCLINSSIDDMRKAILRGRLKIIKPQKEN